MSAEPDTAGFDELYSSGVVFDPAEVARVRSERGPWRELAPRAAPSEPLALGGELITPEGPREGWLVVEGDTIAQITSARPEGARPLATEAVILPGLLDLHNHPEFNVFAAWEPPQQFEHRYRWRDSPIYQQLVRDPQNELLKKVELRTETRYAEIRALVGGVTAIQGASGRDRSREEALVRNVDLQIFGERHAQTMIDLPMSDSSRDMEKLAKVLGSMDVLHVVGGVAMLGHDPEAAAPEPVAHRGAPSRAGLATVVSSKACVRGHKPRPSSRRTTGFTSRFVTNLIEPRLALRSDPARTPRLIAPTEPRAVPQRSRCLPATAPGATRSRAARRLLRAESSRPVGGARRIAPSAKR